MKKISRYLLLSLTFLISLIFCSYKVEAYTATTTETGWIYERKQNIEPGKHHASDKLLNYFIDGEIAYCIEPNIHVGTNNYNMGSWADTGLSDDIKERLILIGYYGYTYTGHQTLKYRIAAQVMIWETVMRDGYVKVSKDYWGRGQNLDISAERSEIENLIAHHHDRPSFNGEFHKTQKGKSIVLTDTNNVLSQFDVNVNGADVSIDGNVLTITPTQNGTINVSLTKRMPYSTQYKLFVGDKIQNMIVPGTSDPVVAGVRIDTFNGKVEGQKKDRETGTPQGQASLSNAEYGIYEKETNNLVTTVVTDEHGYFKSDNILEAREYYIQEITHSEGYKLNGSREYFSLVDKESVYLEVYEDVIKNYISILKQYDYVDGNTTILHPESNITFDILYPDGRKYDSITTDSNGYASLVIPYGRWQIHQVNTHDGFSKMNDFYITVDYDSKNEQYYNILNNKLNAYLQVIKKDAETGKTITLANTTFKILNLDTNQYVSQYVSGKVHSEFKTDESGIFTTYLKLEAGNYRLIEKNEPDGYLLDDEGLDFSIGNNTDYYYSNYGATIVVKFENTPIKGVLEINKTGETAKITNGSLTYETINLEGVVFDIYAEEDILTSDGKHLYYHKGDKVDSLTTNNNGYAISKKLPLGKYFAVEVSTKDNYVLDSSEFHFTLTKVDNKTPVVYKTHSKLNHLKKSKLDFTKKDLVDDEPIEGALIEIHTENGDLVYKGRTDKDGKLNFTFIDLDGNKLKNTLPFGRYYILEKEAPYNYLLNEDKIWFQIKENGEIIKATMKDKRVEGIVMIHKDGERYSISKLCENSSSCFIYEIDENLEGIKYGLYAREDIVLNNIIRYKKGDLISTGTTDENGNVVFEHLYLGNYFVKELETKNNYVLDENEYDINLEYADSKTPIIKVTSTFKNYLIKSDLEFTKTDISDGKPLPNTLVEIYSENDVLIFNGRTDEDGKIILKNIPIGKYYILEKEAPESYVINEDPMWFEVKVNGEVIKANMEDEKIKSTIIIHKVDTNGNIIAGVEIGIFDLENNLLGTYITDENGNIEVVLEYGSYFYQELKTVDKFILNEDKVYFNVTEHGAIIETTLINVKVPKTSLADSKVVDVIGISLIILGVGYLFYAQKRK